ncbi:MAG: hypothetical protein ACREVL_05845, partial [Solimonas sp.]
ARTHLQALESRPQDTVADGAASTPPAPLPAAGAVPQLSLFASASPSAALKLLDGLDPDELSPKAALEALYKLKKTRRSEL